MNQKAKNYIKSNILDMESGNRMDSTEYVQYAVSEAKAYAAIEIAEREVREKAKEAFRKFVEDYCSESGKKDITKESEHYMKVFDELINTKQNNYE